MDAGFIAEIRLDGPGFGARPLDAIEHLFNARFIGVIVQNHAARAMIRQGNRRSGPDSARRAGYQRDFPTQFLFHDLEYQSRTRLAHENQAACWRSQSLMASRYSRMPLREYRR